MIERLSLGGKFKLLISCFAAGFLVFGTASFVTLQQVKVNGPRYERIITGKDLLPDKNDSLHVAESFSGAGA